MQTNLPFSLRPAMACRFAGALALAAFGLCGNPMARAAERLVAETSSQPYQWTIS
ncbi:MAG: hypothetical protein NT154_11820 [Verrucomicrobia bacterium]|nr:hypothetical protein [Verrucomicrobiota bacterium]